MTDRSVRPSRFALGARRYALEDVPPVTRNNNSAEPDRHSLFIWQRNTPVLISEGIFDILRQVIEQLLLIVGQITGLDQVLDLRQGA